MERCLLTDDAQAIAFRVYEGILMLGKIGQGPMTELQEDVRL